VQFEEKKKRLILRLKGRVVEGEIFLELEGGERGGNTPLNALKERSLTERVGKVCSTHFQLKE